MASASEDNGSQAVGTLQRFYDASSYPTASYLLQHALGIVSASSQHEEIIFRHVQKAWAEVVCDQMDEIMEHRTIRKNYNSATSILRLRIWPTSILHAHQPWITNAKRYWLSSGRITINEFETLENVVGTTVTFNQGPYRGSRKEPDGMIVPVGLIMPTVVLETGWSESRNQLRGDMNLWLVGGNGAVKAVLILTWSKVGTTDTVTGDAEYYTLDWNGMPVLAERHVIFPAPPPHQAQTQTLNLTRRILFGDAMAAGAKPYDVFPFRFDDLRGIARRCLVDEGLVLA
ncbi:hypothetical protein CNMCM8694_001709 [Aspergillus lentulus]|nr:hypothetical protein CNMCM8060_001450 [Aspergillus lentulus]KAF4179933.1 hypothetical protein CNMCM7927_001501 [Aspergillus lentulus]KAF4191568.1 hypothetical protein CNMCM8694_001709 [Aspergillus lentulus]